MTHGLDLSRWQSDIDWGVVATQGYDYVILRSGAGNHYTDPKFAEYYAGARAAGIPMVGVYHVLRPDHNVASQEQRFLDSLGDAKPDMVALDVELTGGENDVTIRHRCYWSLRYMEKFMGEGKENLVAVYTADWFWTPHLGNHGMPKDDSGDLARDMPADWALWVAHYNSVPVVPSWQPKLPWGWRRKNGEIIRDWSIWQYNSSGRVPGISGNVDLNTMKQDYWNEIVGEEPPPPPEDPSDDELELRVFELETWRAKTNAWSDLRPE